MILALLLVYCILIVAASLAGGLLPMVVRLTHRRMQIALSVVAGVMLGVAVLHFIPHAWIELSEAGVDAPLDRIGYWLLGGFLVMFLLERFFSFHQHEVDVKHTPGDAPDHVHAHDHALSWTGAMIGLTAHSLLNGVALAAAVAAGSHGDAPGALAGFGAFLVIFLHKPFDAMTIGTLLAASGRSRRMSHLVNVVFALAVPTGAALFLVGVDVASDASHSVVGAALAASAGMFLCIALSDLLPELQFHRHDRVKLSVALLAGLLIAAGIGILEGVGHGHNGHEHGEVDSPESQDDHDHADHTGRSRLDPNSPMTILSLDMTPDTRFAILSIAITKPR